MDLSDHRCAAQCALPQGNARNRGRRCEWLRFAGGIFLGLATSVAAAERLSPSDFTPAAKCGVCHEDIYQQWQTSMHAQAAIDPVFWQFFQQAIKDIPGLAAGGCITCHSPVATVAREISVTVPAKLPMKLGPMASEGVTCDFCHTISGDEYFGRNIGVGIYRYPRRGATAIKYGVHADATTPEHATEPASFLKKAEFCGICHKFTHPVTGQVWQDTYAEWKSGPYAREGRQCQDCHMPQYSGSSATNGPVRADLHAHVFPGGHSEMIHKAAAVSVWANRKAGSNQGLVRIKALVQNVGSGHLMPTGIPGIRQLWLEVSVSDAKGNELLRQTEAYEAELLGPDGQPAMPWKATRLGKDTRIGPRKARATTFELPLAAESSGPLEIKGVVRYRYISEKAAKAVGIAPSPALDVASDRILLYPDGRIEKPAMLSKR